MATGAQGNATGLALRFVEYVREELTRRGMSIEALAKASDMSTNYLATRLRGERLLNLRDFESIAEAFELAPQEMLARVEFEPARTYRGRMVPIYGATFSQKKGMEIFRTDDALPPLRNLTMHVAGEPINESAEDASLVLPESVDVSGSDENTDPRSQRDFDLVSHPYTEETGELMDE